MPTLPTATSSSLNQWQELHLAPPSPLKAIARQPMHRPLSLGPLRPRMFVQSPLRLFSTMNIALPPLRCPHRSVYALARASCGLRAHAMHAHDITQVLGIHLPEGGGEPISVAHAPTSTDVWRTLPVLGIKAELLQEGNVRLIIAPDYPNDALVKSEGYEEPKPNDEEKCDCHSCRMIPRVKESPGWVIVDAGWRRMMAEAIAKATRDYRRTYTCFQCS